MIGAALVRAASRAPEEDEREQRPNRMKRKKARMRLEQEHR